jgi:hypothetical protein
MILFSFVFSSVCGNGTEQNEDADENVTCRLGKIADEIAFENGIKDLSVH